jgi:hypothetical protein
MQDVADSILGGLDIQLKAVHACGERGPEGLHGIFEMARGKAAVAEQNGHGMLRYAFNHAP